MKNVFYFPVAALIMLAGCQSELAEDSRPLADKESELRIMSRADGLPLDGAEGDEINMMLYNEDDSVSLRYVQNNGEWALQGDIDKSQLQGGMKILALFGSSAIDSPDSDLKDGITFELPLNEEGKNDQSKGSEACDLQVATGTLSLYTESIELNFRHKLAKLTIRCTYDYSGYDPAGSPENVELFNMPNGYNMAADLKTWTASEDKVSVIPHVENENTITAYVVPCTIPANEDFLTMEVSCKKADDSNETIRQRRILQLSEPLELKSGEEHTIELTIK